MLIVDSRVTAPSDDTFKPHALLLLPFCMLPPVVMLMFITTTWAEDATIAAVISYAIFYGGFGQMVAGVFEVCTTLAAGNFSQVSALEWL